MTVTKIYTHSGDTGVIYSITKNPVFLELDRQLYPTVYTLWKFPHMIFSLTTWPQLHKKFLGGADLMLPGVIIQGEITPSTFKHIKKGDTCAVRLNGNLAPVAVGKMALSGPDMFDSGMRGKGVQFIHILGDELWAYGDQSQPPLIPDADAVDDEDLNAEAVGGEGKDCILGASDDSTRVGEMSENMRSMCVEDNVSTSMLPNNQKEAAEAQPSVNHGDGTEAATGYNHGDDPEDSTALSADEVDSLLDRCFKCAVKFSLKKSHMPILTSAFYRLHMIPFCPAGKSLDIKKSSFKKLSKFLKQKQKEGFITIRQYSSGVDSIENFYKDCLSLKDITLSDEERSQMESAATVEGGTAGAESFQTPTITEMFSIPSALVHLVKPYGYSKGSTLTGQEMRNVITDYVRDNNLQDQNDKRQIQLDPHLADIVLSKGEGNTIYMSWEDVKSRVLSKTQPAFSVTYPGKPAVVSKGKIEPIKITVEQRASNKKATLIDNLETFGIDAADLAHRIQVGVACSASVNPNPQKGKGMQVLIQGNQVRFVADLLLEKFKVPRKYITGLEKMTKSKKR
ncbi:eukaryotic translation initiation factor 2D-like isoform X2 [Pecten maximus]|nr:eukaryotic translation initiation factor 2D-like isoform X2 [Pecten maximus]XP_033737371.1 eukaryotic translation initiation factor 2D-like isoform X2 [Pecten maximus]